MVESSRRETKIALWLFSRAQILRVTGRCPHGAVINPVKEPYWSCVSGEDGGWMWYSFLPHPTPHAGPCPRALSASPQLYQPFKLGMPLALLYREVSAPSKSHHAHLSIWLVQYFYLQLFSCSHLSGFSVFFTASDSTKWFHFISMGSPMLFLWMSISITDRQNKTSSDVQEGSITGEELDLLHAPF